MKKWNRKILAIIASVLVVCVVVPICFSFTSSAELVDVYTTTNPELTFVNIWNERSMGYQPSKESKLLAYENGVYKMQTNAWGMWSEYDSISFAYTKSAFNTGEGTLMTIQFTVDSWDGKEIGINIRESLEAGSPSVGATFRVGGAYLLSRVEENAAYTHSEKAITTDFGNTRMHIRMQLDKSKGRVSSYYKMGGDINSEEEWKPISSRTCSFIRGCKNLYTGISLSNANETVMSIAQCSNFSVRLQAPEGYVIEGEEGTEDGKTEAEPEVTLPEDFVPPEDALLYETFSDGNLSPEDKEEITISNPVWNVRKGLATVKVNESETNRSLITTSIDEVLMMTAGDMEWTDYSAQMDVMLTQDAIETDVNTVELLFRHRSYVIGGSADYSVTLINKLNGGSFAGQYLQLRWRGGEDTFIPSSQTVLAEVCLSKESMLPLGEWHTIKVEAVDNVFLIYFDDMTTPILSYTDTNIGNGANQDPHLCGCIGLVVTGAYVEIDNILVRKINDPLGGDYDNDIMGNYDEPIPDWLVERYSE